jgi:hypothetical protein
LLANQNDLLRRASLAAMSPVGSARPYQGPPSTAIPPGATAIATTPQQTTTSLPPPILGTASHQYHPAIKAQYRNMAQQPSKPKPTPAPKSYKVGLPAAISLSLKSTKSAMQVPPKQSPVPLPAGFLAAMASSPGTPAQASSRPSPAQPSSPQVGSPNAKLVTTSSSSTSLRGSTTPVGSTSKASQQLQRISVTPVPLPKFSMLPQENKTGTTPPSTKPEPSNLSQPNGPNSLEGGLPGATTPKAEATPKEAAVPSIETPFNTNNVIPDMKQSAALLTPSSTINQQTMADRPPQPLAAQTTMHHQPEGFPDVPGCESMEFVERMMENLRRASQRRSAS